jgi:hypothetical protein
LASVAIAALMLTGCSGSDNPAGPDTSTPANGIPVVGPIILTPTNEIIPHFGESNLSGCLSTRNAGTEHYLEAEFFDGDQSFYAGAVTVNDNAVDTLRYGYSLSYFSHTDPPGFPNVTFDGSDHVWKIAGNSKVPAFTTAIKSCTSRPTLNSPGVNAKVSLQQPLKVEWTGTGDEDILVQIYQLDAGYNKTAVVADVVKGNSYTFTTQQLSIFQPGQVTMGVSSVNHKIENVSGKKILLISEGFKGRHIYFQ